MYEQVPEYLRGLAGSVDADKYTAGIGSSRGPHIAPKNGKWLAFDSAGNETQISQFHQQLGAYADVVVIDANPGKARVFYENDWTEGSTEAPTCFSNDGQFPDEESTVAQAPSCAACQWSKWGSDISKASGKQIKACAERKRLAVLSLHSFQGPVYEFSVSPSNLKTWQAYIRDTIGRGFPPHVLVTRISFGATQGSLVFSNAVNPETGTGVWFVPQQFVQTILLAQQSEETKMAIGAYPKPLGGGQALTHQPAPQIAHQPAAQFGGAAGESVRTAGVAAASPAGQQFGSMPGSEPAGAATSASLSAGATETVRRTRRTKEQMAADKAAAEAPSPAATQTGHGFGGQPAAGFGGQPAAGFGGQPAATATAAVNGFGGTPAAQPAQPVHSFGVASPVAANGSLDEAIAAALA